MSHKDHYTINDLIERLKVRSIPAIAQSAALDQIIDAFEASRHSRVIYVLDSHDMYLGIIELKDISRHILFHYHEPKLHSRELIQLITSETAQDFLKKEKCSALLDEDFDTVLKNMLKKGADEIPVLSPDGKLVADITIVDMIEFYMFITGRDQLGIHPQ